MRLNVFIEQTLVGVLEDEPQTSRFAFTYAPSWLSSPHRFALCPALPLLRPEAETPDSHSAAVRRFFENLLPEGHALDDVAAANKVSKANLVGLLVALGRETAGALRIHPADVTNVASQGTPEADARPVRRILTKEELSQRIRARPHMPFVVWDGKVRLSIAGYQDKIAVYTEQEQWFLVEGASLASTHIIKPEPVSDRLAGLTSNEFLCMRLARRIGLPVAEVELVQVPEPVLVVTRFDRRVDGNVVRRLHVIDACQALGLASAFKYERPYGDSRDVRHIRDGASMPRIFELLSMSPNPAAQRLRLLRWLIFQVLIGNTDAHAKNLTFFSGLEGLTIAPAYDLVSVLALEAAPLETTYAMAVGDAFSAEELSAFEWANFAKGCKLTQRLVSNELSRLAEQTLKALPKVKDEALAAGALANPVHAAYEVIRGQATKQAALAKEVAKVQKDML
jgi:serine/threonine-protein kinase HipA